MPPKIKKAYVTWEELEGLGIQGATYTTTPTAHATSHESGGSDPLAFTSIAGFGTYIDQPILQASTPTFEGINIGSPVEGSLAYNGSPAGFLIRAGTGKYLYLGANATEHAHIDTSGDLFVYYDATVGLDTTTIQNFTLLAEYQSAGFNNVIYHNFQFGNRARWRFYASQLSDAMNDFDLAVQVTNLAGDGYVDVIHFDGVDQVVTIPIGLGMDANIDMKSNDIVQVDKIVFGASTPYLSSAGMSADNIVADSDKWDGYQFADYLDQAVKAASIPTFGGLGLDGNLDMKSNDIVQIDKAVFGVSAPYLTVVSNGIRVYSAATTTYATKIDANAITTGDGLLIEANALANGYGLKILSSSTNGGDLLGVVASAAFTGDLIAISGGTATGRALFITGGAGSNPAARIEGGSRTGAVLQLAVGVSSTSVLDMLLATEGLKIVDAGSTGATEQDWIEVKVGVTTGYIRVFASK